MLVTIIRIEDSIVSCQLEDGHILDIDKRWLPDNIKINDDKYSFTYNSLLNKVNDKLVFNVRVKNVGSIDGRIVINNDNSLLSEEQLSLLKYDLKYKNGNNVLDNDIIKSGEYVDYVVTISYVGDIDYLYYSNDYKDLFYGFNFSRK